MYLVQMLRWAEVILPAHGLVRDRRAVTSIEYVIIALIIATAIVGGLSTIGGHLSNDFNNVSTEL